MLMLNWPKNLLSKLFMRLLTLNLKEGVYYYFNLSASDEIPSLVYFVSQFPKEIGRKDIKLPGYPTGQETRSRSVQIGDHETPNDSASQTKPLLNK